MFQIEELGLLIFTLTGSSVLLIYGSKIYMDSFFMLSPRWLRNVLNSGESSIFLNILSGLTFSLSSLSSNSLMYAALSYGNSGILTSRQVSAFLTSLGLASVLPLWIVVFNWGWYELIFLTMGFVFTAVGKSEKIYGLGRLILGLGVVILASRLLKVGLASQPDIALFVNQLVVTQNLGLVSGTLLIVIGFLLVFLTRSLIVSLILVLSLFEADFLSAHMSFILLLIVFCFFSLHPLLVWKKCSREIKSSLLLQLFCKFSFTILLLLVSDFVFNMAQSLSIQLHIGVSTHEENLMPSELFVSSHVLPVGFVLINLLYMLWTLILFVPFTRLSNKILPSNHIKEFQKLYFLGEFYNVSPQLSVEQVGLEIKKMAAMVQSILQLSHEFLGSWSMNSESVEKVLKYEGVTDRLQIEINDYILQCMSLNLTVYQGKRLKIFLRMAKELESIADNCKALFYLQTGLIETGRFPNQDATTSLKAFYSEVLKLYELLFSDMADEGESIFTNTEINQNYLTKVVELNVQYLTVLKQVYAINNSEVTTHWFAELMFKCDEIKKHTVNLYECHKDLSL